MTLWKLVKHQCVTIFVKVDTLMLDKLTQVFHLQLHNFHLGSLTLIVIISYRDMNSAESTDDIALSWPSSYQGAREESFCLGLTEVKGEDKYIFVLYFYLRLPQAKRFFRYLSDMSSDISDKQMDVKEVVEFPQFILFQPNWTMFNEHILYQRHAHLY